MTDWLRRHFHLDAFYIPKPEARISHDSRAWQYLFHRRFGFFQH